MAVTIALTGADGNMGREVLKELLKLKEVSQIKLLLLGGNRHKRFAMNARRAGGKRIKVIFGDIAIPEDCRKLVEGADYVVNMAAVIPPLSDHRPELAEKCNFTGTWNLVRAIENVTENQPKLVHISTVALYGHRNYLHPWGRVGDPLMPSVYDCYAATKLRAERRVLESEITDWVVLRQTAMLHARMLTDNMKDGLMFHTCLNVPLEWVTASDSGVLVRNLIVKDLEGNLNGFWKQCYNIGGGAANRLTGYDTFDGGFKIIGGSTQSFMKPGWNTIRNFHGLWFYDGDVLNEWLDYQRQNVDDYWREIYAKHRYYGLAKLLPPSLISKLAIQRLLKDENSPVKWIEKGDAGRIKAYFGSRSNIECRVEDWQDFPLFSKCKLVNQDVDYESARDVNKALEAGYLLDHGYDESKPDSELDIDDMRQAAEFRGGKCLSKSMRKGDLYTRLQWQCHDGHIFFARPYTVLKAGHWCPNCCQPEPWDYDRLSKFMPFYAQIWYDTHARKEDTLYFFDENHNAGTAQIAG